MCIAWIDTYSSSKNFALQLTLNFFCKLPYLYVLNLYKNFPGNCLTQNKCTYLCVNTASNSVWMLQGTCMALLGGLLISEDNEDYLPTIIKIPILPLLKFLEPLESDSGFRGTSTCSSSERRHSSFTDPKLVRSSYKLSSDTQHEAIDIMSCTASEVVSENSSHSAVG